ELNNPLVIESDDQWRALTRQAGWRFPNPAGAPPEEIAANFSNLRGMIARAGHDGVVIKIPKVRVRDFGLVTDEGRGKLLDRIFDHDTVVRFKVPDVIQNEPPVPALNDELAFELGVRGVDVKDPQEVADFASSITGTEKPIKVTESEE